MLNLFKDVTCLNIILFVELFVDSKEHISSGKNSVHAIVDDPSSTINIMRQRLKNLT